MPLIQTISPENAEGQAKEIFDTMQKTNGSDMLEPQTDNQEGMDSY
jgi:hypothetical protein